jgi:hypothetical protein
MIQSQCRQIVFETLSQTNLSQKRAGGVALSLNPRTANKTKLLEIIYSIAYSHSVHQR